MIGKIVIENKTDEKVLVVARISWLMQQRVRNNPMLWPDGMSISFNEELTDFVVSNVGNK